MLCKWNPIFPKFYFIFSVRFSDWVKLKMFLRKKKSHTSCVHLLETFSILEIILLLALYTLRFCKGCLKIPDHWQSLFSSFAMHSIFNVETSNLGAKYQNSLFSYNF